MPWYLKVVADGLLEALCSGNEKCVVTLVEHGADITEFGVERTYLRQEAESITEKAKRCRQALQWKILIRSIKDSPKTQHVVVMLDEVKDQNKMKDSGGLSMYGSNRLLDGSGLFAPCLCCCTCSRRSRPKMPLIRD